MDMIKAMIYGIVEGITEWLPISNAPMIVAPDRDVPGKIAAMI